MEYDQKVKRAKVLVIDDDPAARALAKLALKKAGFTNVSDVDNPISGLNKIEWGNFDVVLLDWMMPEIKGIDVLKRVRSYNDFLPIIMLTAEDSREFVTEAIKAGVTDYVVKPWKPSELVDKVASAFLNRKIPSDFDW